MGRLWFIFNPLFVPEQIVLAKSHHVIFVTSILYVRALPLIF